MRFEYEQLLQHGTVWTCRPAELRKCFFSEGFVLDKTLPGPFGKLRRLYVGRRVKKNDGTAIRQRFNEGSNHQEFGFGQIVERMENHTSKPSQPCNTRFSHACRGECAAIVRIVKPRLMQIAVVVLQDVSQTHGACASKLGRLYARRLQLADGVVGVAGEVWEPPRLAFGLAPRLTQEGSAKRQGGSQNR